MSQVLIIDYEPMVARLLSRMLAAAGHHTTETLSGASGLAAAATLQPDLIILDLILPDMPGEDVLSELLAMWPTPKVIVLSATPGIAVRVKVLDLGAADYMSKPFERAELLARVRLHLRPRTNNTADAPHKYFLRSGAGLVIDVERRAVALGGRWIDLTVRECMLLCYLLDHMPRICGREELLANVWGSDAEGNTNVVDVDINRLRSKFPSIKIETVRNSGYRLRV